MHKHCGLLNTALCLKRSLCGAFKLLVSALTVIGPYLIKSLELKTVQLPFKKAEAKLRHLGISHVVLQNSHALFLSSDFISEIKPLPL